MAFAALQIQVNYLPRLQHGVVLHLLYYEYAGIHIWR